MEYVEISSGNDYFCLKFNTMTYTIKIKDNSPKAKSIINMLKALKEDYDFIEIEEESKKELELERELDKRYKSFQKDAKGKDWEELKEELK